MQFKDREDAGKQLAEQLANYKGEDLVVYGLPRGGVVLAKVIAEKLEVPIDLLIPRKVGHPTNPEYAVCAVTEDGQRYCNQAEIANLDEQWLESAIEEQIKEAKRRRRAYLSDYQRPSVSGKTAIIVDDGIATGLTMHAALAEIRSKNPGKVVMAVPVMPAEAMVDLKSSVDEIVAVKVDPAYLGAVGAYYQQFDQVSDEQVIEIISTHGE